MSKPPSDDPLENGANGCLPDRACAYATAEAAETLVMAPSYREIHRPPAQFFIAEPMGAGARPVSLSGNAAHIAGRPGEGAKPAAVMVHYLSGL